MDPARLARAAEAIRAGVVPADLRPLALAVLGSVAPASPCDRLAVQVSAEVDRLMRIRGVTQRTISAAPRSVARCLKAENVTIGTVANVADALDCDVVIQFRQRRRPQMAATLPEVAAQPSHADAAVPESFQHGGARERSASQKGRSR